jgi:hypothetical protein
VEHHLQPRLRRTSEPVYARIRERRRSDEAAIYGRRRAGAGGVPSQGGLRRDVAADCVRIGPGGRIEAFTVAFAAERNGEMPDFWFETAS